MTAQQPRLYRVVEGLYFARVYWIVGEMPSKQRFRNEVKAPPNAGWSHCFVIDKGAKLVTLFCPYTLEGFQVSRNSAEYTSLCMDTAYKPHLTIQGRNVEDGFKPWTNERHDKLLDMILKAWDMAGRLSLPNKDYDTAAMVISMLGGEVPLRTVPEGTEPDKPRGGKEVDEVLGLLKPVKRSGRRGQVLAFFLAGPRSIREAMAEFGVTRSNLLSQLYLLNKDHGIGYTLTGDAATITLPAGCTDPFEAEEGKKAA